MHISVPLAMFCLDAMFLNYDLCERAQNLSDRLIHFQVDINRNTNSRYRYVCAEKTASGVWPDGRMAAQPDPTPSNNDQTKLLVPVVSAPK